MESDTGYIIILVIYNILRGAMERSANSFGKTIVPSVRLAYGLTHGCVRIGHCSLAIRITLVYSDDMMWVLMRAGRFILCGNLNILAVAAGLWVHQ